MDIHKNARLTPHSRVELVCRVLIEQQTPKAVATAFGVCCKTVCKWVERFKAEGEAGLQDRSSRPHHLRCPTCEETVERIEALRRERRPASHIAKEVGVSPATVSRVLKRLGLNKLNALDPPEPVRCYERQMPGELLHIDIKKLGKFKQIGHRITGDRKGQSNARSRGEGPGWELVHVCIDDASRIAFSQIKPNERKQSAVVFLKAAVAYYKSLGVTVARVMTDNGSCYKSRAFAAPANGSSSNTSAPNPIRRRQTARPSASSKRRCASGLMPRPIQHQIGAPRSYRYGFIATIGIARMVA